MHSTPASDVDSASVEVPTLETDRLWLRPWRASDVEDYARIIADPEVMRYVAWGLRYEARRAVASLVVRVSDVGARRWIGRMTGCWRRYGFGEWAVEEKESGTLIGRIGLARRPDWVSDTAKVEVGWMLARSAWGRGFATEGGEASLAYAFERLGLDRVVSIATPTNRRSVQVMERLGLSLVGTTRRRGTEVVWYAIDSEAWERRRAARD